MRSVRVGDAVTAASSWARALRYGGIQIASNFDTRPSEVVFPQPSVYGTAAVPSTLDVYVNGQLRSQLEVPGGSFEINDIPVVTGSGQVQVVARDLLGREQLLTQDFYSSERLLRPGLNEYSWSFGRVRRDFAVRRNAYGPTLMSGVFRRGLTQQLTIGGQFAATSSKRVIGISVARTFSGFGVTTASSALSQSNGSGTLWLLGHQYQGQRFRGDVRIQGTTARFTQPGLESLPVLPKRQVSLSAGFGLRRNGSVGLSLVSERAHSGEGRQISTVSYSRTLPAGLTLSVAASKVMSGAGFREASIGLSRTLGPRSSTSVSLSQRSDGDGTRVDYRYELPTGPGFGYRTSIERGYRDASEAAFLLNTSSSHYGVEVRSEDGDRAVRLQSRGSLARYGGAWFATREISNGFAVVDAGGIEGVNVFLENRPVGRTRADGLLIVPGLRPYELNRIRIETADIPIETLVDTTQLNVTPYYRSGALASFGVRSTVGVSLRVVFPDGQPVPEGARARVANTEIGSPVGLNGRLYLEGIEPGGQIEIEVRGEICVIDIEESATSEELNSLGNMICRRVSERNASGPQD
jgi:outer membrane usher protein